MRARQALASATFGIGILLCGPAGAVPITSFEGGEPGPGASVGDASDRGRLWGIDAPDGNKQYQITTIAADGAVGLAATESAMGLSSGTVQGIFDAFLADPVGSSLGSGPTQGSAFQITFDANAGDRLIFEFDLVTAVDHPDLTATDFAWSHLAYGASVVDERVLGHVAESGFGATTNPNNDHLGYETVVLDLDQTGTYTITLGLHDVDDTLGDTRAIFDWFRILPAPEPGTFGMLAAGLLALNALARRQRRC